MGLMDGYSVYSWKATAVFCCIPATWIKRTTSESKSLKDVFFKTFPLGMSKNKASRGGKPSSLGSTC